MALTRREFVCRSFASFGTAVLAFERFGLLQALAQAGRLQGSGVHLSVWWQ